MGRYPRLRAAAASAALLLMAACGGGGGATSGGPVIVTGTNVATVVVDAGPPSDVAGTVNLPFVTVTVCVPGTTTCTTVDHVLLDTGSTGLRLIASVLPSGFALPQLATGTGDPVYECMTFADGYSWGSVRQADVQLADGTASNISIHVIGDATVPMGQVAAPAVPADCSASSPNAENTVNAFGANGVIGLSTFKDDCGLACQDTAISPAYYDCSAAGCVPVAVLQASQVVNPVYHFASNNNGIVLQLPAIGSAGQLAARGSLVLGIDTQSNNALGSHKQLTLDPLLGYFTTTYKGVQMANSFIDSGSNGYFFTDSGIPGCTTNAGFYCPTARLDLTATNTGQNGTTSPANFSVVSADTLTLANPTFSALPNVAGANSLANSFDWGLPFFYGRSVYVGFEGRSGSNGIAGPWVAY
jgi:hypothetical protein